MKHDVKIPRVGESVQEALLSQWYKQSGDLVRKDEPLLLIETDKVTLEMTAEVDGKLDIMVSNGQTVAVGSTVGVIDTGAAAPASKEPFPAAEQQFRSTPEKEVTPARETASPPESPALPPSVRRLASEHQLDLSQIQGSGPGGRITKSDVLLFLENKPVSSASPALESHQLKDEEPVVRTPMSPIRKRIAARLLESRHNTAMLTTFNDIDMSRVIDLRKRYHDLFQQKYQVKLGFMSFFVKACIEALKEVPQLNAWIEGNDLVYHQYYHIGVAVGSERGLVVPVIRHADRLSFAEIEHTIQQYVEKINANRLELFDLEGGTFTITNGGVFGSLLSTPILNTPQSGILGMHKIDQRPVVVENEIVIRPMMYVALSYDHRIVDGRESVMFLKRIKECIEHPERLVLEV
ncbi:MAG: 2-oxoglutarate dehydrogenase complex dihydrolipoyllysine-residue succinyltransferase [Candidatus Vecturithrix sp.]|jgi:2-oxoglutarate dehydrogenase E2 component (dihydrolipoamide succinyltransferase)|nr:2-oxoglutarate dehydrogenase complex dihydrolipoyllysine-residue succinyltransferase [Candidatus Vecturithrix sp.]